MIYFKKRRNFLLPASVPQKERCWACSIYQYSPLSRYRLSPIGLELWYLPYIRGPLNMILSKRQDFHLNIEESQLKSIVAKTYLKRQAVKVVYEDLFIFDEI